MRLATRLAPALCAAALAAACTPSQTAAPAAAPAVEPTREVMTAEKQKSLTPAAVLAELKEGNRRFVEGRLTPRDYRAQAAASAKGQYPKAVVLSCLDSRVPPEIVFDQGIGDLFVGRVAGNVEDVTMLGSMEFATKAAGAKLIVVLGHTACGAVKGAIDRAEMGNLTALLREFDEAVGRARKETGGPGDSSNDALVRAATEESVRQTMSDVVSRSPVIAELVKSGEAAVVGGVYDLATGSVTWLE